MSNSASEYNDSFAKSMKCALGLLERRAHSVVEIRRKLAQRRFPAAVIEETMNELERLNLLDDQQFAVMLIREKLLFSSRPVGDKKLFRELARRGIDQETARAAWEEIASEDQPETEEERAWRAAEQKLKTIRDQSDKRKVREKLWRHLASRGFSAAAVQAAVGRVLE